MKIAIFGVGLIYQRNKYLFKNYQVEYIIDNAEAKQGSLIDGMIISAPNEVDYDKCSYIIIMVQHYDEIRKQLLDLGVSEDKIVPYTRLGELLDQRVLVYEKNGQLELEEWLSKKISCHQKIVMIFSHELSYSGVPVALLNLAKILKTMGYIVILAGLSADTFEYEIQKEEIDYINNLEIFYEGKKFLELVNRIDFFIAGTLVLSRLVSVIAMLEKPVMWWIHESDRVLYDKVKLVDVPKNVHIYTGGSRVKEMVHKRWHNVPTKELLYFIPDWNGKSLVRAEKNKVVFAIIGFICSRKGQDIFLDAVISLPEKYREQMEIIMIGKSSAAEKKYISSVETKLSLLPEVKRIGVLSQEKLENYFEELDVLVCASRDDPMPIVVTQAMMHRKTCIISDNVGQCEFVRQKENGFVFHNEDSQELAQYIMWLIDNRQLLDVMGRNARRVYENYFSEECMRKNIKHMLEDLVGGH